MIRHIAAGACYPLGANMTKDGYNFAIYSANAENVELCFFDTSHNQTASFFLQANTNNIWHGLISGLKPGDCYGYRIHGRWQPEKGLKFNPNKLLLDPYATKISHIPKLNSDFYAEQESSSGEINFSEVDNSKLAAKGILCLNRQPTATKRPNIPWSQTVIYEAHVKGLSQLHPAVPHSSRGKLSALKHPSIIDHFKKLGITSIQLMPIQAFATEQSLLDRDLTNYWGYNPISLMAIHPDYCESDPHLELTRLIEHLHQHKLELILDVVFNHSAESNHLGPHYSWRGIDNSNYYLIKDEDQNEYHDYAGCGNVFNSTNPAMINQMIDALEHWASFGVDGFRFDLSSLLALDKNHNFDNQHPFFVSISGSKKLQHLKMIAEPWDLKQHKSGQFGVGWSEYNDYFRKNVKKAVSTKQAINNELAHSLAGTNSLFSDKESQNHRPINYITNHDGFSLQDLVSFESKHNQANGENNQDGSPVEYNCNYGIEGLSADTEINERRLQHMKNLLALLFFAQGVPMIRGGDEFGQSHLGNNNTYCQDNELTWINWSETVLSNQLQEAIIGLISWRKENSPFFKLETASDEFRQILWFNQQGNPMTAEDWQQPKTQMLGMMYLLSSRSVYLLINFSDQAKQPNIPKQSLNWKLVFCSCGKHDTALLAPSSIRIWKTSRG